MSDRDDTGKLTEAGRRKLLAERAALEQKVRELNSRPASKTEAGRRFDRAEVLAVASQMVAIDRKLGRA